ncbi:MAG: LON peptidase substrate-binding domain-containing protein [Rhodospirillales bacterium]
MIAPLFIGGPAALPETIPVFPLTGALLLPHGRMPLNIFEPRYVNMMTDALGEARLIGMVQPKSMEEESPKGAAEVYSVGCLGRIAEFSEADDGRFLITLSGMNRFRAVREAEGSRGYRRMAVSYAGFEADMKEDDDLDIDRDRLLDALKKYFIGREIGADWPAIQDASNLTLVISLSMACPFDPREKQALLECATSKERAELLAALLTMASHASGERPGAGH